MYKGWIEANKEDAEILRFIGIELGPYDEGQGAFEDCTVSEDAMVKLDDYWGQFFWELTKE
jgi:hypothetical protein